MNGPKISKLQFYSLGIVAVNKLPSSELIEVTPVEEFPMLDGELSDAISLYKTESVDYTGGHNSKEIATTVTIEAQWLPINNSNRRTPPDVRRGEKVVIYRFADTDKYWWNTLFNDSKLRRLETVIYTFINESNENTDISPDNTYYLEISTHKKLMHVHTAKNDGEPFSYDVQINAKEGIIIITDDAGNYFELNSRDTKLSFVNADASSVFIDKKNIELNCEKFTLNASDSANINTPITNISDDVNIGGNEDVKGNVTIAGNETVTGAFSGKGGMAVEGSMTNNGTNIGSNHTHGGVKPGPANTGGPE